MPRYIFPAGTVTNTTGAPLRLTFHATSTTGRRETDLWTVDGSSNLAERIPNGVILTTSASPGAYSAFAGPDDVDTLYVVKHDSSTRTTITATSVVTGESGLFPQVVALTGSGIDLTGVTDSTTALNALLAANPGKTLRGVPGSSYLTSAPLVVKSGTTLDMTGCTVTLAAGSNCNMLQNTAVATAQRSIADAAISSSSTNLTSATASFTSSDVGRSVVIQGALASASGAAGPLCAQVQSVTNSTTVVLTKAATTTVSAASASIYDRDHDIAVIGGTWVRGANAGSGVANHSLRFRRVDRLTVRSLRVTSSAGKYAVSIGSATTALCSDLDFSTSSDGIHIEGDVTGSRISNITGTTGDDMVAMTARSAPGYAAYEDVTGDIVDISLRDIYPAGSLCAVKVIGGTGTVLRGIYVGGIYGATTQAAVRIQDDQSGPTDVDITVDGVFTRQTSPYALIELAPSAGRAIRLRDIHYTISGSGAAIQCYTAGGTGSGTFNVALLEIDGLYIESGTGIGVDFQVGTLGFLRVSNLRYPGMGAIQAVNLRGTSITSASIRDTVVVSSGAGYVVQTQNACTITRLVLSNIRHTAVSGGGVASVSNGGSNYVQLSQVYADGISQAVLVQSSGDVSMTDCVINTFNSSQRIARITSGTGTLRLRSKGLVNVAGCTALTRSATEAISGTGLDLSVDVSTLTPTAGDAVINSNAAVAPFVTGPAIYDGTQWRNMSTVATKTGTATLVGGTVTVADTSVTANSIIRLAYKTIGGTPGAVYVSARTASTSFAITSTSNTDTSVVQYYIDAY